MPIRPFHNRGQNTKVKINTGSQWIVVTLSEAKLRPKIQTDQTSGTGGSVPVFLGTMRCSLRSPRDAAGAANTSRDILTVL